MADYEIVHEMDREDGTATRWSTTLGGQPWWIALTADGQYSVETRLEAEYGNEEVLKLHTCGSFEDAQKWIKKHWHEWVPDERI